MFTALAVTNIGKVFPGRPPHTALDGVSFMVSKGQIVSLIGANGAGKSTLIKLIVGLDTPTRGSVTVLGRSSRDPLSREAVGYMPEQPAFLPSLTAWQWLLLVAGMHNIPLPEGKRRAAYWLREVGLWTDRRRRISGFSKGMRQRLAFAHASLAEPDLLLLDEPLDGLDPLGRLELKKLIQTARTRGTTVILCSHILSDIAELSDRIGVLNHGRLSYFGPTKDFVKKGGLEKTFVDFISHE